MYYCESSLEAYDRRNARIYLTTGSHEIMIEPFMSPQRNRVTIDSFFTVYTVTKFKEYKERFENNLSLRRYFSEVGNVEKALRCKPFSVVHKEE